MKLIAISPLQASKTNKNAAYPFSDQENQGTCFSMQDKAEAVHKVIQKAENSACLLRKRGAVANDAKPGVCACL